MAVESQEEYFVSKTDGVEGKTLSVFYAPISNKFTVPREVLIIKSHSNHTSRQLWELIVTGRLSNETFDLPTIEPSSINQVGQNLDLFMRTERAGGIFIDAEAPEDIHNTLKEVERNLTAEAQSTLADLLGIEITPVTEDKRPLPGLYL